MVCKSERSSALCCKHSSIFKNTQKKYAKMYEEFIMQLHIYAKAIRILAKGYLLISLITPSRLKEILDKVKTAIQKTNPD